MIHARGGRGGLQLMREGEDFSGSKERTCGELFYGRREKGFLWGITHKKRRMDLAAGDRGREFCRKEPYPPSLKGRSKKNG